MRLSKAGVPLEDDEQIAFVQWCRASGILVHHSPNEVSGSTEAHKRRAAKMKRLGTSSGFPDLVVYIPVKGIDDEIYAYQMLAIEMKKKKGSTTSKAQKEWLKVLEMAGIPSRVCKGCEEAIKFVEEIKKEIHGGDDELF